MQLNPSEISELLKQRIEGMGLNTNFALKVRLSPLPTVFAVFTVFLT